MAKARQVVDALFSGGPLNGKRKTIDDTALPWRELGPKYGSSAITPNDVAYHKYVWDGTNFCMVYQGTVFGIDDDRSLRRVT